MVNEENRLYSIAVGKIEKNELQLHLEVFFVGCFVMMSSGWRKWFMETHLRKDS
jgi:hypothetical protein